MPNASATTRSAIALEIAQLRQLDDSLDRKSCATQAIAQGFPPRAYADRMRLEGPTCDGRVGGGGRSGPERPDPVEKSLGFFPRHDRLPQSEQRRCPPRRQEMRCPLCAIAGRKSTGIVAAEEADRAVVSPFEM